MSRRLPSLFFALLVSPPAVAADGPPVFDLWPGPAPGEKGDVGEEKATGPKSGEKGPVRQITNVSRPAVTLYRPAKDRDTGAAVVIAPGGGYNNLAWEHEGTMVGEWLRSVGVTGVLLKYRVPRRPGTPASTPPPGALQDAQRAIRLTRSRAKEWSIDPNRVGMLGFSAGGHLTAWAATNPDTKSYDPIDDADRLSARPDFAVLIYPGGLIDRATRDRLSPEIRVTKATPPCFLAVAYADSGPLDGSLKMLQALKAAGVPAELHVYATGGHGFGMRPGDRPHAAWPKRCEEWLQDQGFLSPAKARAADPAGPVAPGAKAEKVAGGFEFTEGPTADAEGNVYFTDQPTDRILKWSTDGTLSTFLQPAGRANGLCFDAAGRLWACADAKNELWRIDPATKAVTVVAKDYRGKLLNGPNDVWVRPDGGAYFTDPFYKRGYWTRGPEEQDRRGVYYVSPDGKLSRVDDDYGQPNGLVGTPDGKTLYVADIGRGKTFAYDVRPDGSLANRRLFCSMGSDGMTLDADGNVYLTGKGVTIFDKSGARVGQIEVPEPWTANVCFGGKDMTTLFITAGKGLYAVKMTVRGASRQ